MTMANTNRKGKKMKKEFKHIDCVEAGCGYMDIEAMAYEWEKQEQARQEVLYAEMNSCEALMLIDGVRPAVDDDDEIE